MNRVHVLVACSDPARGTALVEFLARFGCEPLIAADINEVRAVLAQHSLQLAVCEHDLPESGYREALSLAKATGSEVLVVVCSRLSDTDQYLEAMQLGAFDFVVREGNRQAQM